MLALVLGTSARLHRDHPEPLRPRGEALVRMRVAGICDTDLELVKGYMGYRGVLGHEFVGEVLECDDPAWLGRRVVADINAGCGACEACIIGKGHHCRARTVLGILGRDGALAERLAVPVGCLVAVPDTVDDERAVFAEPLAAALHVEHDLLPGPVIVLGDGKLGLLVALSLRALGRDVTVVGHHEAKLGIARAAGASTLLEAAVEASLTGVPNVVEATGTASGLTRALSLVRPRGRVVLKSTVATPTGVDLTPVVVNELGIIGSRCGSIEGAVEVLSRGAVDPSPLVAARYPLAEAETALEHAARKGTIKVLVRG